MSTERSPMHTRLAETVEPGSLIDPEEYLVDSLYRGIGGNLGRIAIFRGEATAGRLAFQGYQVLTIRNGWMQRNNQRLPVLKTEAYFLNETTGTAFRPTELITNRTPNQSEESLLDWLITQDLVQAEIRLKELDGLTKELRRTPFIDNEIAVQKELIRYLKGLPLY